MTKIRMLLAICALPAALAIPSSAHAIVIRDDVPDSSYVALGQDPAYDSVGSVQVQFGGNWFHICGATLVADDVVATAQQCLQYEGVLPYRVVFRAGNLAAPGPDAVLRGVSEFIPFVDNSQSKAQKDPNLAPIAQENFGLMKLSAPVDSIELAPLYFGNPEGLVGTFIGFGRTGTGLTGDIANSPLKRGCENLIETYNKAQSKDNGYFTTVFDAPGSDALALEGTPAPGDAGGGIFVNINGVNYLAGTIVASDTDTRYAAETWSTALDTVKGFVHQNVPGAYDNACFSPAQNCQ